LDNQLHIIIVEDDAVISQLIEKDLTDAGHKVLSIAHNSTQALDSIHNHKPDLILLDIDLGHSQNLKDGIGIAHIVNEKYNIPFIYLTAHSDLATVERAKQTRPCGYIIKPYRTADLFTAIAIGTYNFKNRTQENSYTLEQLNAFAVQALSNREFEIIQDIVDGYTNAQIAQKQFISLNTIKWHIQNIYSKMDVKTRTTLVKKVFEIPPLT
jgi:DNA-binding NarL/FixJ family response regulator